MESQPQAEKLHAACDECRARKLKCSGESPACSRCRREKIQCIYSPQKQMGRPRKRRRDDIDPAVSHLADGHEETSSSNSLPMTNFGDLGIISPPELDEFANFANFQSNGDVHTCQFMSPSLTGVGIPTTCFRGGLTPNMDINVDPAIDPSLWDAQPTTGSVIDPTISLLPNEHQSQDQSQNQTQSDTGPCTCLSIMYLSLSDLQALQSFSFPAIVPRLRQAMAAASTMINCEKCPKEAFSTIQNVQSLSALLSAIAERFHCVLKEIDAEAERLEQAGEKKPFRVGDTNPALMHLHTGTEDCPMGFNLNLDPREWQALAKKALKTEVLGGGSNKTPLMSLIKGMEERQKRWHSDASMYTEDRIRIFGPQDNCANKGDDATCLRMIGQVKSMIAYMQFE